MTAILRTRYAVGALGFAVSACSDTPTAPPLGDAAYEIVYVYATNQSLLAGELYVITPDGRARRRLTPPALLTSYPAWSPDGQRVIFDPYNRPTEADDLGVIDADGSNLEFLAVQHVVGISEWSPDATRLAVFYTADPFTWGPAIINTDGSGLTPIASAHKWGPSRPSWSPTSDSLLLTRWGYSGGGNINEIWLVDAGGTVARPLAVHAQDARWSPNGEYVVFFGAADPASPGAQPSGVVVMNADGSSRRLVAAPGGSPVWSPDSRRVAFTHRHSNNGTTDIYVVDISGGAPVNITHHGPGQHAHLPDWAPAR